MTERTRLRYRVVLTVVDMHRGGASVDIYDTKEMRISRSEPFADPSTVHLVQDVQVHLGRAVRLSSDDDPPPFPVECS